MQRGTVGNNVMYFETGQGSALSANAHHGVDQQTLEARAYAVARKFKPLLVNTVVGFIGPEYLYDGKQIIRAGLEDHFCGKLLGVPMGCDICYTNHAEADQNDMDVLLTLLAVAGVNFIMGIPGSDDIMLNYQTTSFHDALYAREDARPEGRAGIRGLAAESRAYSPRASEMRLSDPWRRPFNAPWRIFTEVTRCPTIEVRRSFRTRGRSLRQYTPARIALGRSGTSLPTKPHLEFQLAHARARKAVHHELDIAALASEASRSQGLEVVVTAQRRRVVGQSICSVPTKGECWIEASREAEAALPKPSEPYRCRLFVIGDGLSALAIEENAAPFLAAMIPALEVAAGAWRRFSS